MPTAHRARKVRPPIVSARDGNLEDANEASPRAGLDSAPVLAELLDSAPDAIVAVGRDGRILLVNAQTERLFGYRRDELIGEPVETLIPERFRAAHVGHRSHYFADAHTRPMGAGLDLHARRRDGSEFPAEISLSCIETEEGLVASAAIRDVTDRKRLEQELRHLAEHDSLTDLLNRRRFEAELSRQVALARRYGHGGALLSVDLDGFKAVNDTYGHPPATSCCGARPRACGAGCARRTWPRAWAATSSPCFCRTQARTRRRSWRARCSKWCGDRAAGWGPAQSRRRRA